MLSVIVRINVRTPTIATPISATPIPLSFAKAPTTIRIAKANAIILVMPALDVFSTSDKRFMDLTRPFITNLIPATAVTILSISIPSSFLRAPARIRIAIAIPISVNPAPLGIPSIAPRVLTIFIIPAIAAPIAIIALDKSFMSILDNLSRDTANIKTATEIPIRRPTLIPLAKSFRAPLKSDNTFLTSGTDSLPLSRNLSNIFSNRSRNLVTRELSLDLNLSHLSNANNPINAWIISPPWNVVKISLRTA